jgi:hypothetical protein
VVHVLAAPIINDSGRFSSGKKGYPGLQGVKADAVEVLHDLSDGFHPKRSLHHIQVKLDSCIAHIIEDIDRKLALLLAFPYLFHEKRQLFRVLHAKLCKTDDAQVNACQVPVRAGDGIKEIFDYLGLEDISTHIIMR